MATNQLLPFASGESPNVLPFADWNSLPARLTGFQSGIASSQQFNRIFAQGGVAGYILGQLIVDQLNQDATLDPDTLYENWKSAIAKFIPSNVADGSIDAKKLLDDSIAFAKLASAAIASSEEAKAGEVNNKLMTPQLVAQAIAEQIPPAIPTGMLLPFAGTVVPEGFLLCNGANVSRTDYANLFAAIGTKWGEGDGSTTFTLPNFNDRFIEGTTDTEKVGQYLEAGAPNMTGTVSLTRGDAYQWMPDNLSGALLLTNEKKYTLSDGNIGYRGPDTGFIQLDSSKSNSKFGLSDSIQPSSSYALIIIKE